MRSSIVCPNSCALELLSEMVRVYSRCRLHLRAFAAGPAS